MPPLSTDRPEVPHLGRRLIPGQSGGLQAGWSSRLPGLMEDRGLGWAARVAQRVPALSQFPHPSSPGLPVAEGQDPE